MASTTFPLTTPLEIGRGTLTELTLNRPLGRSFVKFGVPFSYNRTQGADGSISVSVIYNPNSMRGFIADMAGLTEIDVDLLDGHDMFNLFIAVQDIIQSPQTPSA